jgi:hypothetical protein
MPQKMDLISSQRFKIILCLWVIVKVLGHLCSLYLPIAVIPQDVLANNLHLLLETTSPWLMQIFGVVCPRNIIWFFPLNNSTQGSEVMDISTTLDHTVDIEFGLPKNDSSSARI